MNADRREILMIENIVKPELPQSTLDLIKSEKSHTNGDVGSLHSSTSSTSRRYEFHLILNNLNGMVERMQLMTKSYDDLRLWIIGLNALIANKNNLMRLSTMIKSWVILYKYICYFLKLRLSFQNHFIKQIAYHKLWIVVSYYRLGFNSLF